MQDVPKISPLVAHTAPLDPLASVIFTNESIVTVLREGHIKIWIRPGHSYNGQSNSSDAVIPITNLKGRPVASSVKTNQPTPVISS